MHIDVDFDVFYQTLTKMQKPEDATRPYKHVKRKQDPTIDALLGYHRQQSVNVDEIVYKVRYIFTTVGLKYDSKSRVRATPIRTSSFPLAE